jgi:serine protein kinase
MRVFDKYQQRYENRQQEEFTLQEYLELCKDEPLVYATASERILAAIGEPELIDTSNPNISWVVSPPSLSDEKV